MSKIKDLLSQIAALQSQVAEVKKTEVNEAIDKVRAIVEEYDLAVTDIFPSRRAKTVEKKANKVAAKYKDPVSGKTWSGRGITPKWLAGKNKSDYSIAD